MVSYYEHALQKGEGILRRIEAGESCALCSDAGMPCVSDPGEVIVRDALARGIKWCRCRRLPPASQRWPCPGRTPPAGCSRGFCL